MMHDASKYVTFLLVFCLGFGCFAGALYVAANTITINELKANNIIINTDEFLGDNPEVSIEDLTIIGAANEIKELSAMGDTLTLEVLITRYDLILPETMDKILTEEARKVPISKLFTMEGVDAIAEKLFIGHIEKYECRDADGNPGADPRDPSTYWYNPAKESVVTGIDEIIADFSLYDILHGQITADNLLSELTIANLLGYTLGDDGKYYNGTEKVTGILAIFADCTIFNITDKINETEIGNLIGYTFDEEQEKWVDDAGNPVHGFMNVVANRHINDLGSLMDDLTIGDIIPESQRTGVISIIPADTSFDGINTAVNNAVMDTPLQFFINEGLVSFDNTSTLDSLSMMNSSFITTIEVKEEGEEGYDEYLQSCSFYGGVDGKRDPVWTAVKDSSGNVVAYKVPTWRTKPLSQSFDYIVGLIKVK